MNNIIFEYINDFVYNYNKWKAVLKFTKLLAVCIIVCYNTNI